MKRNVKTVTKLALAVCLVFTLIIPAYALSAPIPEEEFLTQLKEDANLSTLTSEDDVIDYVTGEGEKAAVSQSTIDKTIKEVMKSKSENTFVAEKKTNDVDSVILQKKQEHMEKMEKVENEIQKYVDYDTKPNKAENIEFLLNNSIGFDEELMMYYISGYAHHVKDDNVKKQLEEYLNITSELPTIKRF